LGCLSHHVTVYAEAGGYVECHACGILYYLVDEPEREPPPPAAPPKPPFFPPYPPTESD
jgi:hypothetical protein